MFIYHPFIDSCLSESNIQNSMSDLHKDNNYLLYNKLQENIANKYVSIFSNSQQFYHCYIDGTYIQYEMSASPISYRVIIYSVITRK